MLKWKIDMIVVHLSVTHFIVVISILAFSRPPRRMILK